ncbi:MAG: ATP-binding protein [Prolixibacteraceae bacterium]|nr:ATP-binding protein [Prolixibacteraceae bacterium]
MNRYDGYDIVHYFFDANDSSSIPGNVINDLLVDRNGNLWAATNHGIAKYIRATNNFERLSNLEQQNFIVSFMILPDNRLIACSPDQVCIYDLNENKQKVLVNISDLGLGTDNRIFSNSVVDKYSNVWVFTIDKVLKFSDANFDKFEVFSHPMNSIHKSKTDKDQNIWFATLNGIFQLDADNNNFIQLNPIPELDDLFMNETWDIEFDSNDNIWFATTNKGLFQLNKNTLKIQRFFHDEMDENTISNDNIRSIFIDDNELLWIGSQHAGIDYTLLNKPKNFKSITSILTPDKLNSNLIVSNIEQDNNGQILISTDGDGLGVMTSETTLTSSDLTVLNSEIKKYTNFVLTIENDHAGNLWFGGFNIPFIKYSLEHKRWTVFNFECAFPKCNGLHRTRDILADSRGNIWFATNHHGVIMLDTLNQFHTYDLTGGNNYAISLEEINGQLWIGTYDGLVIMEMNDPSVVKIYKSTIDDTTSITSNWVYDFYQDEKKRIWIATSSGLNLYHPDSDTFEDVCITGEEQNNDVIASILGDDIGNLWLATQNGIVRYIPESDDIKRFTVSDGLPSNSFFINSCKKHENGDLYFGSTNGLVFFTPSEIKKDTIPPNVVITNIQLFFEDIDPADYFNEEEKTISYIFKYNQSTISFNYAGLNFWSNTDNRYEYKLVGYGNDWLDVGNRREAVFTNLDPGAYTFTVRAINKDGVIGEENESVDFIITPPWWATTLFRIFLIFLGASILYVVFQLRIYSIKRQKIKLQELVQLRTSQLHKKNSELEHKTDELNDVNIELIEHQGRLEKQAKELVKYNNQLDELNKSKDKFFSIIAHDLKNPFGTVLGFSNLLIDDESNYTANEQRQIIYNIHNSTQRIYDLLENLLIWSGSQLNKIEIKPIRYCINQQILKVFLLLEDYAMSKKIKLIFDDVNNEFFVLADESMIETVFRNLITNAIKFTPEKGVIHVLVNRVKAVVKVSIKDTGVGMTKKQVDSLFKIDKVTSTSGTNGEEGTGLGLSICFDFIKKNKGEIWVESKINKGTTFFFSLRIQET